MPTLTHPLSLSFFILIDINEIQTEPTQKPINQGDSHPQNKFNIREQIYKATQATIICILHYLYYIYGFIHFLLFPSFPCPFPFLFPFQFLVLTVVRCGLWSFRNS